MVFQLKTFSSITSLNFINSKNIFNSTSKLLNTQLINLSTHQPINPQTFPPMDFKKVIYERESVRDYDPNKPVDKEILDQILEAGRIAPSANNRQPWLFLMISTPENLNRIRKCYDKEWYKNAPHVLVVVGDKSAAWIRRDGYNAIETDLTIAMDHLILAAENLGVGTCWIANFDDDMLRETLHLTENQVVFAITPLGYSREGYQKRKKIRKSFDEVVRHI